MQEQYPELKDRIQASFIDTILLILLMFAFASILDNFEHVPDWVRIVMFAALFIVYEPLCMVLGFTLGNYIKRIRVRRFSDSTKRINIFQAMVRYPIKMLLGWVSFLTINSNKKKKSYPRPGCRKRND